MLLALTSLLTAACTEEAREQFLDELEERRRQRLLEERSAGSGQASRPVPSGSTRFQPAFQAEGELVAIAYRVADERVVELTTRAAIERGRPRRRRVVPGSTGVIALGPAHAIWIEPWSEGEGDAFRVASSDDLESPDGGPEEWRPDFGRPLDVSEHRVAGPWVAWLESREDERFRIALGDVTRPASEAIDLGAFENGFPEFVFSEERLVWRDRAHVYALVAPFDTAHVEVLADLSETGSRLGVRLRGEGALSAWQDRGEVFVFDATQPIEPGENPRRIQGAGLHAASGRFVLYRDPDAALRAFDRLHPLETPRRIEGSPTISAAPERQPKLFGRYVVWTGTGGIGVDVVCSGGPSSRSVYVEDLTDPDPTTSRRSAPVGSRDLTYLRGSAAGVAWWVRGCDERIVAYWNPDAPTEPGVNPVRIPVQYEEHVQLSLDERGLTIYEVVADGEDAPGRLDHLDLISLRVASDPPE
ncbi:MAG: hypothetical protein AAGC67_14855 [Myxococcota bacterium]